jgi:Flp pilus assembly protein TadD
MAETILVLRPAAVEVDVSARAAVHSGRYQEAVEQLRVRLASVPEDQEAWRLLGLAEVGAGRFDQAIEAWTSWASVAGPRAHEAESLILAARTMLEAMREHRE